MQYLRGSLCALLGVWLIVGTSLAEGAGKAPKPDKSIALSDEDPNIWLEDTADPMAQKWVRRQNKRSLAELVADPAYKTAKADALALTYSDDRVPYGRIIDGMIYNFWQDRQHVQGIWRRTSLESYATETPDWEPVLDLDELSRESGITWVYSGATCFRGKKAAASRCMISMSNGGQDYTIGREFDLATLDWVAGGFELPEGYWENTSWIDEDTLLLSTSWFVEDAKRKDEGAWMSGVLRWHRDTPADDVRAFYSHPNTDASSTGFAFSVERGEPIIGILKTSVTDTMAREYFLIDKADRPVKMPLPSLASFSLIYEGHFLISLDQDWAPEGQAASFQAGDLVSFDHDAYLETGELPALELVFRPNERQAYRSAILAGRKALISYTDNVIGKIARLERDENGWQMVDIPVPGEISHVDISYASPQSRDVFLVQQGFVSPDQLLVLDTETDEVVPFKASPAGFDASGLTVRQIDATSADGTRIPYFVVHRSDIVLDGRTPTLLYGYGGFGVPITPYYSDTIGKLWLEQGGAYAVASIRGGGEFGPEWHQAALAEHRYRSYEDFIAVAEDMIARGITSPDHLGIKGESNGGLLVGVMLTARPDLWNAAIMRVPLLDMLRYHLLGNGSSWTYEYGDPDVPEELAFLRESSPYHKFDAATDYPKPFFITSTTDYRVPPAHARKLARRFEESGKSFLFYEHDDGGHAGAANLIEYARQTALEFVYLRQELFHENHGPH